MAVPLFPPELPALTCMLPMVTAFSQPQSASAIRNALLASCVFSTTVVAMSSPQTVVLYPFGIVNGVADAPVYVPLRKSQLVPLSSFTKSLNLAIKLAYVSLLNSDASSTLSYT